MACSSCQQHRQNIVKAASSGQLMKAASLTVDATKALGENAGRKLIRTFNKKVKK